MPTTHHTQKHHERRWAACTTPSAAACTTPVVLADCNLRFSRLRGEPKALSIHSEPYVVVDEYANVLSLQIIAMWMTKIRETNRRKTRRPPSGVCSTLSVYLCTFTQKLHPLPQIINFLRQRSTLLALQCFCTVSLELYTLFSGFHSPGCSF